MHIDSGGVGSGTGGVEGESAGIAEAIEDFVAGFDLLGEALAGVSLVNVVAGFESSFDGDAEGESVFLDIDGVGWVAVEGLDDLGEVFFGAADHVGTF